MSPATVVAVRDAIGAHSDPHRSEVCSESESAQYVVEENGNLETVAAAALVAGYGAGIHVEGRDGVGVCGVVVQP